MRLRLWSAIIIFISSYSPLALILFINDFDPVTKKLQNPILSVCLVIVCLLSLVMLKITIDSIRQGAPVKVLKISNKSGELVNYTIPYLISFFGINLGNWQVLISFIIFLLLLCILTIRTQNIFVNPILAARGYCLYEVEFEENGKRKQAMFLVKGALFSEETCLIRQLSQFLYFVTLKNPKE